MDGSRLLQRGSILNPFLNWKKKKIDNESVYVILSSFEKYLEYNKNIGQKDALDEAQENPYESLDI